MKYQVIAYYANTPNSIAHKDDERSVPVREITCEEAEAYKGLFEAAGFKRRENNSQVWYTAVEDARHCTEYIFYK